MFAKKNTEKIYYILLKKYVSCNKKPIILRKVIKITQMNN